MPMPLPHVAIALLPLACGFATSSIGIRGEWKLGRPAARAIRGSDREHPTRLWSSKSVADGPGRLKQKADLRSAADAECILDIDGRGYNLTTWAKAHPGGVEKLRNFHGRDATKAFHAVGHSPAAHAMLREFVIPSDDDPKAEEPETRLPAKLPKTPANAPPRWRQKLFTKEDPVGVHKCLGLYCLLHYAFRFGQMYFGDPSAGYGTRLGKGSHVGPALCLIPHALLSLSSLIFRTVPRERVVGKPMIWREYRVHNIAFALRSVVCTFLAWLSSHRDHATRWRRVAVVGSCLAALSTSVVADVATNRLRTNKSESTTATMPYWDGCSARTELRFKTFYAFSQFMGTIACVALCNPVWSFATMFAIQGASFLMTLVRKGFLSTRGSHVAYTVMLIMPYLAGVRSALYMKPWHLPTLLAIGGSLFQLRRLGVNKYALWVPVYVLRILYGDRFIPHCVW